MVEEKHDGSDRRNDGRSVIRERKEALEDVRAVPVRLIAGMLVDTVPAAASHPEPDNTIAVLVLAWRPVFDLDHTDAVDVMHRNEVRLFDASRGCT